MNNLQVLTSIYKETFKELKVIFRKLRVFRTLIKSGSALNE